MTNVPHFAYGTPGEMPMIGMHDIVESQARMAEIRFLHLYNPDFFTWSKLRDLGLMHDDYMRAFLVFIELLGASFPDSPMDPVVSAFLLVVDVSLNPSMGYPYDIGKFDSFLLDTWPGSRFVRATERLARNHRYLDG